MKFGLCITILYAVEGGIFSVICKRLQNEGFTEVYAPCTAELFQLYRHHRYPARHA
jgi:hypothetical protein